MEAMKVLFHINETEKWKMVLANIDNLIKDAGRDSVVIEVVANGVAVSLFHSKENTLQVDMKEVERLGALGVKFTACRNSLRGLKISEDEVSKLVEIVPAGITEIIIRQNQGYAYVKP